MSAIVKIENLEEFIIEIKGQKVLIDSPVANSLTANTNAFNNGATSNPIS